MSHDREGFHPLRASFRLMRGVFLLACVLVALFAVVGYAAGWIQVRNDPQEEKATIEIETGEVKQAAQDAIGKGQELIRDAGKKIENRGGEGENAEQPPSEEAGK